MSTTNVAHRKMKVVAASTLVFGLTVAAASAASAAAVDAVTNGSFQQPGANGVDPTGWVATNFDNETAPFRASIATYDTTGQFPPPAGTPGGDVAGNFASEAFYQAGSSTGVEGFGGVQTLASPVSSATVPQLSWSTVETNSPSTTVAAWAGSLLEVDLSSGPTSYKLRYLNPFTPKTGTYSADPVASDTATTKYVVLQTLTFKQWYTQPARDLAADVSKQFGLSSFTVNALHYGDLELTTSSTGSSPFPNMTSYWKNISLASGAPVPALPESPLALGLPLLGLAVGGGILLARRGSRLG